MAIPYNTTVTGTSIRDALDKHLRVKHSGSWQHVEDVNVKHSGAWRDVKEVWIKQGGSWRLVHEGEHFLFNVQINDAGTGDWSLANWITGQGYNGNKIKGAVIVNSVRQQLNLGNFSSDSKVYLRINVNSRITGKGGNGGTRGGQNGQNGQRALYTRTNFILDNAGTIAGGGGGGAGGNNAQCTYTNTYQYGCMKGQQCQGTDTQYSESRGGGGGGGAGYPGGSGADYLGNGGQQWGGGGGGANEGCNAVSGGKGGDLGQNGDNASGTGGSSGTGIDGWSYRYGQSGNNDGDIRGPKIN